MDKLEIKKMLEPQRKCYELAVYSSENYFNFGAIVRTAHCFMCRKIWMIDFDKFYKKASMGTHKYENIEKISLNDFLNINKDRNIVVFERRKGLQTEKIFDFIYPEKPIFFFGSEKFGVPKQVLKFPIVSIPMDGIHNDLNMSVAASIVMFDFVSKQISGDRHGNNMSMERK